MEVWWFPANSIGKDLGTIIQVKRSPSVFVRSNMVQHYPNPPGHQLSWPYRWVDTISSMLCFHWQFPKSKWFWFQISLNVFTLNFGEDDPFFGSNSFTIFDVFWYPSRIHVFCESWSQLDDKPIYYMKNGWKSPNVHPLKRLLRGSGYLVTGCM